MYMDMAYRQSGIRCGLAKTLILLYLSLFQVDTLGFFTF